MKNFHILLILLTSILIAATVHYIEYQFLKPKSDNFCPNDIPCFHDYEKGLKAAQKWQKPIFLAFTGWACVSNRRMEENMYADAQIRKILKEKFVLITLFVDEKTPLPQSEQFEHINYDGQKRKVTEMGEKWSYFQTNCFHNNTQPMFALLNFNEELLQRKSLGYTPYSEDVRIYLQEGLQNFQKGISKGKLVCQK